MAELKTSPFKVDTIEDDPNAFGLRVKEITSCAEALYNKRSVLISGPRGIGKSSLGTQMQTILEGDHTLLRRCGIDSKFPRALCLFNACDEGQTIAQLALDLLFILENKCLLIPELKSAEFKPTFEVNLGVFKATLESTAEVTKRSPGTIANQLVSGIQSALKLLSVAGLKGVNIMLDEVDQLSREINFGHFMKITHEMLATAKLPVTFILAGQRGIYTRFMEEDASFERMVRHVDLSVLQRDDAEYVLDYAAHQARPRFDYEDDAKALILSLSTGYPYVLHLLGDAGYMVMQEAQMSLSDVLAGLEEVLRSDKQEKYLGYMKRLGESERLLLIYLSQYAVKEIPAEIPVDWLRKKTSDLLADEKEFESVFESLVEKGYLSSYKDGAYCRFAEELFRVFVSLFYMEHLELQEQKRGRRAFVDYQTMQDSDLVDNIRNGQLDMTELDEEVKSYILKRVRRHLERVRYLADWDIDEFREITNL